MGTTSIATVGRQAGGPATVEGWLYNKRSSGKIQFLIVRDGTGYLQVVVPRAEVPPEIWEAAESLTQESSLRVSGTVRGEKRAPGGFEMTATEVTLLGASPDYPISPKEHGVDFLMAETAGTMRYEKTSKTPAIATDEVTTNPNEA